MSVSSDSGHFFQSNSSLETSARRARKKRELGENGKPITLPTKILAIVADPRSPKHIFAAEAGNVVRRVDLETDDISEVYRGHTAPVTCLATNADGTVLFTGSWDKRVLAFSTTGTREVLRTFTGHSDFVKALQYIPSSSGNLLASASSDASIIIFNADTGERLRSLKSHARGVQCLALDPACSTLDTAVLYSGDSRRDIKRWIITKGKVTEDDSGSFAEHETGVNRIIFAGDPGEEDMWTASSDNTAKRFERGVIPAVADAEGKAPAGNDKAVAVKADTALWHKDFVNDIVLDPTGAFAVTACSDEGVRVWDIGSGDLHHTFEGHWDVVTALLIVKLSNQYYIVSSSLDCTLRRWSLSDAKQGNAGDAPAPVAVAKPAAKKQGAAVTMTEEEERELADLMEDDED